MSWRDLYQQGSFRGVPFRTTDAAGKGGHRVEIHEFPGRNDPYPEPLGEKAKNTTLTCWVAGDDYFDQRDALEAAFAVSGPGTLVHPFRGIMTVQILDWSVKESAGEGGGGIADYEIEFVKYAPLIIAPSVLDTSALAGSAADTAQKGAPAAFKKKFSVAGAVAFVNQKAAAIVAKIAQAQAIVARVTDGVSDVIHAVEGGALLLVARTEELLRAPEALATQIVGFVQTIGTLGSSAARLGGLFDLAGFGDDLPAVIGDTPARQLERDNQAALIQLVSLAASAELVRTIADTGFVSFQDAVAMRDRADDLLDRLMLRAADAGDDDGAQAFTDLRHAMIRDVTARGANLARLQTIVPAQAEPALVIAHRLYGSDVEARAAELVARNHVAHPGFVPGGRPLEILAPSQIGETGNG